MTPTLSGVLGLVVFLIIIMMLRMPIAYAMAIVGFVGYSILVSSSAVFRLVSIDIFTNFASYSLTVVPMFIFMGFIALYSGVGGSLFSFSSKFLGHFRGGLALATQAASALFGAISGSMLASVATIGSVALPEMRKHNYNMPYSAVSIAAGSLGLPDTAERNFYCIWNCHGAINRSTFCCRCNTGHRAYVRVYAYYYNLNQG